MRINENRIRQIIREEARRVMREAIGRGSRFLADEFMKDHDDSVDMVRDMYGNSDDPVADISLAIEKMARKYGYSADEMSISDAAIEIARDIGAERRATSKSYHERDIEDPYGPE